MKSPLRPRAEPEAAACERKSSKRVGDSPSHWECLTLLLLLVYGSQPQVSSADLDKIKCYRLQKAWTGWSLKKGEGCGSNGPHIRAGVCMCACTMCVQARCMVVGE